MFTVDILGNLERLSIWLARPSGELLNCIDNYIDENTSSLSLGLNQIYELSFTIYCQDKASWFDALQEGMYLFVEKIGLFKMNQPSSNIDDKKYSKDIIARSCETELEDKNCSLQFNMGLKTSQEYLVTYDEDETESLINPYTGIPYDWIVLYNTFPEQLSNELSKVNSSHYGSAKSDGTIVVTNTSLINELNELFNLIPRLKNKIIENTNSDGSINYSLEEYVTFQYDSNNNLTSITLESTYKNRISDLVSFYTKYREQLSLLSIVLEDTGGWTVGDIYGVSDGDYSLANRKYQFDIGENKYSFLTQTLSQTIECIIDFNIINRKVNITPVDKIGKDTGIVIAYENLLNTLNTTCDEEKLSTRLFVSGADDLSIEQVNFGQSFIDNITYKLNAKDNNGNRIYVSDDLANKYTEFINYRESLRDEYIQLSKDYSNYLSEISEIKYRVPNDGLNTDWSTYSQEELENTLTSYKNLLCALISLYKEEYGNMGLNSDGSVNEDFMKQTIYWYDYEAYQYIIKEIECAISTFPYYSDQEKWSSENKEKYKDVINAWETEWSLYGTIELQAKIDTYKQNMDLLAESSVIRVSSETDDIKTWDELTDDEKSQFGNLEENYYYDTYMEYYNNKKSAEEYLKILQTQINELQAKMDDVQTRRNEIVTNVSVEKYFTKDECKIIYRLYRDSDYSNENILVTSIDSSDEKINKMYELLEDAKEKASIFSRPQLEFSIDSENLLGLKEYKSLWNDFSLGNFILVQYKDDTYVKLRMVEYTFNPCLPSAKELNVTFSNYIRSRSKVSDIESLLGLSSSSGGMNGSSSTSGGKYGESDDIDVTISNTMLAKLLNSETFGTRVTNVILDTLDTNSLTAKYAKFDGLSKGSTIINGKCIETGYIKDIFYNGTDGNIDNTKGSIINLETGKFNLADGRLVFDGSTLKFGDDVKLSWNQVTGTEDIATTSDIPTKVSELLNDSGYQDSAQVTTITKDTVTTTYVNSLAITAKAVQSDWVYAGNIKAGQIKTGSIASTDGVTTVINLDNGKFNFAKDKLTWDGSELSVSGKITATSGSFKNMLISGYLTTNSNRKKYNDTKSGMTIDTNGIGAYGSSSQYWNMTNDGTFTACGAKIIGDIYAKKIYASTSYSLYTTDAYDMDTITGDSIQIITAKSWAETKSISFGYNVNNNDGCSIIFSHTDNSPDGSEESSSINIKSLNKITLDTSDIYLYGKVYLSAGLSLPDNDGDYIFGKTSEKCIYADPQSVDRYQPVIRINTSNNNIWNLGGIDETVGFYGFYSGRTENGYDWATTWNVSNGELTHSGAIIASKIYIRNSSSNESQVDTYNDLRAGRLVVSSNGKFGLYDITSTKWLIYSDSGSTIKLDNPVNSLGIYNNTTTGASNVYVSDSGNLKRSTSASKYKLDIQNIQQSNSYAYNILRINPRQWFDKVGIERYSAYLDDKYNNCLNESESIDVDLNPVYGLIAEDLVEAGLSKFCEYGAEKEDGTKELEGIHYDRLPILYIPILRDLIICMQKILPIIKDSVIDKTILEEIDLMQKRISCFDESAIINKEYSVDTTQ